MLGDDDRPPTAWRALRAPEFWLLLVGCIAAAAGVGAMVVVPLIVAGLTISSLPKYMTLWPCGKRAVVEGPWWRTVALSMLNTLAVGCVDFVPGTVARWQWL
jgi:hypothetical protein